MNVVAIGINHKTAPIEIREKFYLTHIQQDLFLSELKSNPSIVEGLVLSTCNRTEVYLHTISTPDIIDSVIKLLKSIKKTDLNPDAKKYFYLYEGEEAVSHLLHVTAGLDSLVLGESQILGQVKSAAERSREMGLFNRYFNVLSNIAIRAAKKAHTETAISYGGSSVSRAAISMAEGQLETLSQRSILIIGAGKMGELALDQVKSKGVKNIYLMNRTEANALALAKAYDGIAVPFCDIKEVLSEVDVCICSASAPHYIIEKMMIEKVMLLRDNRKLILIDISMPRNIDPQVAQINNVFLAHIDDLDKVVGENMLKRQAAIPLVEAIIDAKIAEFKEKLKKFKDENAEFYSESIES